MSALQEPVSALDHQRGHANASVVLVEYGDYQCPYCAQAYAVVVRIREQLGASVLGVFRHFPLMEVHPQALPAAIVAEYAAEHGKFWQAHDLLYQNQRELGPRLYTQLLERLDLPMQGLEAALAHDDFGVRIRRDLGSGVRSGVTGTPAFFVNGQSLHIESSYEELLLAVQAQLGARH